MNNFIQKLLSSLNRHKTNLPEDLNSLKEVKQKSAELLDQHADSIDKAAQKIPGTTDDKIIDQVKKILKQ